MIGAVAGDIMGSPFEFNNTDDFFFHPTEGTYSEFRGRRVHHAPKYTDDTVLTLAVADWLMGDSERSRKGLIERMKSFARMYPDAGYGPMFAEWVKQDRPKANKSYGNGAAMRVSPVGLVAETKEECLALAELTAKVSHDHPEAVKGAQAMAYCVWRAKRHHSKEEFQRWVEVEFGYDLDTPLRERSLELKGVKKEPMLVNGQETGEFYLRDTGHFDASCQVTVPAAIRAFIEGGDFESVTRLAISAGGDSDTIAAMAASIADPFYGGVPKKFAAYYSHVLDTKLSNVMHSFERWVANGMKMSRPETVSAPSNIVRVVKFSGYAEDDTTGEWKNHGCIVFADSSRPGMVAAVRKMFGEDVDIHPADELASAVKVLDARMESLDGTVLVPCADEVRTLYLEGCELKPISLTESYGGGTVDDRLAARNAFLHLRREAERVRDELHRACGYEGDGVILFEKAIYPLVKSDSVAIMKDGRQVDSISIDASSGRLRVTGNEVFRSGMDSAEVVAAMRRACLDEGVRELPSEGEDLHIQVYERRAQYYNVAQANSDVAASRDARLEYAVDNPSVVMERRLAARKEMSKTRLNTNSNSISR